MLLLPLQCRPAAVACAQALWAPRSPLSSRLQPPPQGQGTDLGVTFSQSPGSSGPVPRLAGSQGGGSGWQVRGGGTPWLACHPFLSAVLTSRGAHPTGPPASCSGGAERHGGESAAPHCPGGLPQPAPGESLPELSLGPCGEQLGEEGEQLGEGQEEGVPRI